MTVAGALSPFDRMYVTLMPAGNHARDMGELVWGQRSMCNGNTSYRLETHALHCQVRG